MKITDSYDHRFALNIINSKPGIWSEIQNLLNDKSISFGKMRPNEIKNQVSVGFNKFGWADKVRVHPNFGLTVSFIKEEIGLCFQLGNVSRTYADILKLDLLGSRRVIVAGCIVVPDEIESKLLGTNYAKYGRLKRDIMVFEEIINTPILILALAN